MKSIGLFFDSNIIYLSSVIKIGSKILIKDLKVLDDSSFLKRERFPYLVTCLLPQEVFVKELILNIKNKKGILKKAIAFHEKSLILDLKETVSSSLINYKGEEGYHITSFITTKDNIESHLKMLEGLDLRSDHLTSTTLALVRFATFIKAPSVCLILHLGETQSICVLKRNNMPISSYVLSIGKGNLLKKELDILKVDGNNYPECFKVLSILKEEILKVFLSFLKREKIKKLPLLITGAEEPFLNLKEFLSSDFERIKIPGIMLEKFAVSLGVALEGVMKKPLQFLKGDFFPHQHVKKIKIFLFSCFCFSLFLSAHIFYFSNAFFKGKTELIKKELTSFIEAENKEFELDIPCTFQGLQMLGKRIQKDTEPFSFMSSAPKVARVISWLDDTAVFEKKDVDIKRLKYELVSFPAAKNRERPYLGKVSLELRVRDPNVARKIQSYLLKGDNLVDEKRKITWEKQRDKYLTTFFLKNDK